MNVNGTVTAKLQFVSLSSRTRILLRIVTFAIELLKRILSLRTSSTTLYTGLKCSHANELE